MKQLNYGWANSNLLSIFISVHIPILEKSRSKCLPASGASILEYLRLENLLRLLWVIHSNFAISVVHNFCRVFMYSELSNKHAANLILFEKIFLPTCLIRTYTFIYFQGKFLPTRLLEYLCLLILAEIPNYKIILSSFKLLFCCFKHIKVASKS